MENGHPELTGELEAAGAVVLDKTYVDIEVNGNKVRIGGMYDYAFGLNGNNDASAAPSDTLSFLQEFQDTDSLKIMLAHRPDSFIFGDASKVWNVDLVVSGHNHGGQVVIPFLGGLYGGDQGWFPEYIHGIYQKDKIRMFVTSGLGTHQEKLPRFNNPPEIAVLTIQ
ncbi:metallophosphoesterase [Merdimonas faecis]